MIDQDNFDKLVEMSKGWDFSGIMPDTDGWIIIALKARTQPKRKMDDGDPEYLTMSRKRRSA